MAYILKSNLIAALETAIKTQEKWEVEHWGYISNSALLAGWKTALKGLEDDNLEIRY